MPLRSPNTPRKPRILLVPPPELPVPAVQGGAVETLVTHLIRENERAGKLDLLCASIPDPEAAAQAQGLQHTKMLYVAKPRGVRRYYPMVFLERCFGVAAPYDPWYQKVQLSLALELPTPDLIVAEGGTLTQCSAISKMFGKRRCLAHLHGQTSCSHEMDAIYGGILALSEFIRDDYLKTSELDRKHAYILHNCIDTARFVPGPADAALRASLGFAPEDFVVLFCGRLEPDKGIHKLLEAMENIHDPRIGGMPEYLDGSQAVLVDRDGNVAGQLSFAIRMLYEHPDLRAQMSTAGAKTAQRYSSARFYDDFVRIVYDFGGHLWNSPSSV